MEPQVKNKETQVSHKDSCKEPCVITQVSHKDSCKEPYVITQEDIRTMRKLTYQLGKLNESLKKFEEMAAKGGLLSSFLR